jgi:short-subunit dehydrogenase
MNPREDQPEVRGKWAIVTGASSGIGRAIALQLACRGYDLLLVARNRERLQGVAAEVQGEGRSVHVIALDLAAPGAPEELLRITDQYGVDPEVVVNNAGVGQHGAFLERSIEGYQGCIDLNLSATVRLSRLYAERMAARGSGYLLQVGSVSGFLALPGYSVYAASKAFVLSFSRALSFELRSRGVSSTVLCPGYTATNFFGASGHRINRFVRLVLSEADDVARSGVDAMFARKVTCVPGFANQLLVLLSGLCPAAIVTRVAALINAPG